MEEQSSLIVGVTNIRRILIFATRSLITSTSSSRTRVIVVTRAILLHKIHYNTIQVYIRMDQIVCMHSVHGY
jgi:hypothetical protein